MIGGEMYGEEGEWKLGGVGEGRKDRKMGDMVKG